MVVRQKIRIYKALERKAIDVFLKNKKTKMPIGEFRSEMRYVRLNHSDMTKFIRDMKNSRNFDVNQQMIKVKKVKIK